MNDSNIMYILFHINGDGIKTSERHREMTQTQIKD